MQVSTCDARCTLSKWQSPVPQSLTNLPHSSSFSQTKPLAVFHSCPLTHYPCLLCTLLFPLLDMPCFTSIERGVSGSIFLQDTPQMPSPWPARCPNLSFLLSIHYAFSVVISICFEWGVHSLNSNQSGDIFSLILCSHHNSSPHERWFFKKNHKSDWNNKWGHKSIDSRILRNYVPSLQLKEFS